MIESYLAGRVDHYSNQVGQMIGSARSAKYILEAIASSFKDVVPDWTSDKFENLMKEAIGYVDDVIDIGNEKKDES